MRFFKQTQQGAILLEALMAVVILTVGLTFILQAMMQHLRAAIVAREYYSAAQELDNAMTGAIFTSLKDVKPSEYECEVKEKRYQCKVMTDGLIPSSVKNVVFQRVNVRLSWPSKKGERAIEVPYYLAKEQE